MSEASDSDGGGYARFPLPAEDLGDAGDATAATRTTLSSYLAAADFVCASAGAPIRVNQSVGQGAW